MEGIYLIITFIVIIFCLDFYYPKTIKSNNFKLHNQNLLEVKGLIIQQVFENKIYCSMGNYIYVSEDKGKTFERKFKISVPLNSLNFWGNSRILRSLMNYYEFLELKILNSGTILVFADNKIYRKSYKEINFKKVNDMKKFDKFEVRRVMSFGITEDANGHIYYGEYTRNTNKDKINIYISKDDGITWNVYYTFNSNEVRHIHSIQYDQFSNRVWVTTGDLDNECIIGYFDEKDNLIKVFSGSQNFRCVSLVFTRESIYWAMDAKSYQNYIFKYDRYTKKILKVSDVDGPVYYGIRLLDDKVFFETAVEGGDGEWDNKCSIWIKENNKETFERILTFKRDDKSKKRSNIRFPKGDNINFLIFTVMNSKEFKNSTIINKEF